MSGNPKISVVIPVYNSASTLTRSIESILNQTFTNFEFIIVIEFGTDRETMNVLEKYAKQDSRIKLLQPDSHVGISKSLNMGIRYAEGQYIARMDADDYSYPQRFAKQLEFMETHPDYLMCGTAFNIVDVHGKRRFEPFFTTNEELRANLLFDCVFCHPTVMFRRSLFDEEGLHYNEDIIAEDYELWTRVSDKMANLPEVLFDYYYGKNNATLKVIHRARSTACDIIKRQLQEYLKMELGDYPDYIINIDLAEDMKINSETALIQAFNFLKEIEEKNNILNLYDKNALAAAECRRWNKYLWYFYAKFADNSLSLPILDGTDENSFVGALSKAIGARTEEVAAEIERRAKGLYKKATQIKNIVVFGAGMRAKEYFEKNPEYLSYVGCFCDSNAAKIGTCFMGKSVFPPSELKDMEYDWLLISSEKFWEEIVSMLENQRVDVNKVSSLSLLQFIGNIKERRWA